MRHILILNPNTSEDTTRMMVDIARDTAPAGFTVRGATAATGVPMIVREYELKAAALEVLNSWSQQRMAAAGIVVSAFGDPGLEALRRITNVPVVGICEAAMLEAAVGGRRFGIATVTPDLVVPIEARVHELGLTHLYTGIRLTPGEPRLLAGDPAQLEAALGEAVAECIELDGAQAVVIGGGPLGQAAIGLASRFAVPIVAPIPAAMRQLTALLMGRGLLVG